MTKGQTKNGQKRDKGITTKGKNGKKYFMYYFRVRLG